MPLFDGADARDAFRELGMLPQEFPLECVTLLTSHRRDLERIIGHRRLSLDRLLWPGAPGVGGGGKRGSDHRIGYGQVGGYDFVGVFLKLADQLVAKRLASACASARLHHVPLGPDS